MTKSDTSGIGGIFRSVQMDDGILSQRAAQQIAELVTSGELREGDRLPSERELGEHLGVSRTVVREAIKMLKAAGLVRVRPGVGSFVTEPTTNILEGPLTFFTGSHPRTVEELVQARELLEPGGSGLFVTVLVLVAGPAGTWLVAADLGDVARRGSVVETGPDHLGMTLIAS